MRLSSSVVVGMLVGGGALLGAGDSANFIWGGGSDPFAGFGGGRDFWSAGDTLLVEAATWEHIGGISCGAGRFPCGGSSRYDTSAARAPRCAVCGGGRCFFTSAFFACDALVAVFFGERGKIVRDGFFLAAATAAGSGDGFRGAFFLPFVGKLLAPNAFSWETAATSVLAFGPEGGLAAGERSGDGLALPFGGWV